MIFDTAQKAFEYYFNYIMQNGIAFDNTKAILNEGFTIKDPLNREINTPWRKWNKNYAEFEWQWYLSGNPDATEIAKKAKIWYACMDKHGDVNSNYGYQWNRKHQYDKIKNMLINNPQTRKAAISLYDGKEIDLYEKDTICTYAIHFQIVEGYLNMSVLMRSCDLVYGFCNDQYCFSKLLEKMAADTNYKVGTYYHFVSNLHIYPRHFNANPKLYCGKGYRKKLDN